MTDIENNSQNKTRARMIQALIILFLLIISITIPAIVISISMQSEDQVVELQEEPLNKKQGLPERSEPDDGDD